MSGRAGVLRRTGSVWFLFFPLFLPFSKKMAKLPCFEWFLVSESLGFHREGPQAHVCVGRGAKRGGRHWLGLRRASPEHLDNGAVTCLQPLGAGRPRAGISPGFSVSTSRPQTFFPEMKCFLIAGILNTNICLPFPHYILCWQLRSFWQLLNVFRVLCSLEIETIMPVFLPPDFCFYTLFCFLRGWDGNALAPLRGSIFKFCQNCKWDLCVLSLHPVEGKHLPAIFIFNLFCVCEMCVCERERVSEWCHLKFFEEIFGLG